MGYVAGILNTYFEPRRFINKKIVDGVNERELLALTFGIALLSFASNSIGLSLSREAERSDEIFARLLSSYFAVAIFFVPIFLYFLAAIFHGLMRLVYKVTPLPLSRVTFFWALFLCMPFQILVSIIRVSFTSEHLSIFLNSTILLYFIWLWSIFDSEIFGLKKIFPIFMLKLGAIAICFATVLAL